MYNNRNYMIFNISELNNIDFSTILETGPDTLRLSVDGSKTFVKWDGSTPECINNLTTKEGPFSHEEIIEILNSTNWNISEE